jgi:argininosuccinate synthase
MFELTVSPEKAPNKPTHIEITFKKGIPTELNGKKMDGYSLIEKLNKMGGANGIGRVDMVENRLVGIKSRGVYETPGGTILYTAHKHLESLTLDRETSHYKELVSKKYAELVYYGQWFTPLKGALDEFMDSVEEVVSGVIRLKLYKGNCTVVGRKSPNSLYDPKLATFEEEAIYDQKDAEGFINLFGLPLKVQAIKKKKQGG